jgi:heme exporter protein A
MISLEAKYLAKSFGYRTVFEGINFSLKDKESLVIVGRNGSGKTTLLKILAGLLRPSKGEVIICSEGQTKKGAGRKKQLGFVAPDLCLYDELTALENLEFLAKVQGLNFIKQELKEKLEKVGLKDRGDDLVSSYSSGMKQRLKYACALLNAPQILLLDEPGSNLDDAGILLLDKIVTEQKGRGILILATSDKRETKYGDKILNLDEPNTGNIP